jgi:hypothetical protein
VAIFRRRGRRDHDEGGLGYDDAGHGDDYLDEYADEEYADEDVDAEYPQDGPFDETEAPEDEVPRLDLGSLRVPVPDGAQLQVEMDNESGGIRAVHLLTELGQFTLNAYAAPRSGGLWREVGTELAEQLRKDGASVVRYRGEWGEELAGKVNDVALRFLGVDGPRWMVRAVSAGPEQAADQAAALLREIVRGTVVVRGDSPLPVRTPLPVQLPQEIAEQLEEAKAQQEASGNL